MRAGWVLSGCALAATPACVYGAAAATSGADTRFANYAFASELGSGVYESGGRTLQVYQFRPSHELRAAEPRGGRPGVRLLFPVTVGFYDYQPIDLAHGQLPSSIGALSLEPGVELDYWITDAWHVYPYARGGSTWASSTQINAMIFGAGVRSDYRWYSAQGPMLWRSELAYAGVHYESQLPNDSFTRLRNGIELRRNVPTLQSGGRALQLGPYAMADVYVNAPQGPASGIGARTVQFQFGLMFDVSPGWQIHGWTLPRLGIGYLDAGALSGWRLVIGDPF